MNRLWQKQEGIFIIARTAPTRRIVALFFYSANTNGYGVGELGFETDSLKFFYSLPRAPEIGPLSIQIFSSSPISSPDLSSPSFGSFKTPQDATMTKPAFRTTLKTGFGKKQEGDFYLARTAPRSTKSEQEIYLRYFS